MKQILSFFLCLCILFPLVGCSKTEEKLEKPVNFYYRRAEITYDKDDGVIMKEQRESLGHENDVRYLLSEYLAGPVSSELNRTFPEELVIISLRLSDSMAEIVFSHQLATLTGLDLTIACACITLTVIELTGVEKVQLSAAGTLLGDYENITMDKDCLLLLDTGANTR